MSVFTGTWQLVRLAARRDRVLLPVWIVSISVLAAAVVASVSALYANAQERTEAVTFGAANIAARIFDGPASGTELGAMSMVEAYLVLAILVALMSAQAVVRHTRQDEETGRAELLGAGAIGRYARLTAALLVAVAANLVLTLAVAGVLIGNGLAVAGALASGGSVGAVGMVFAGIAAVAAQLSESQRGANGLAALALGIAFLARAVGDATGSVAQSGVEVVSAWPSWLSPLGWGQQVRPFHQDNWAVFGLFGLLFVGSVAVAFALTSHRDVGAGFLGVRPGPGSAAAGLRSPIALAWRLQRGSLLAWSLGLIVLGAAFGAVGESVDEMVGVSERLEELIRQQAADAGLVELYFTFLMGLLGIVVGGYVVQALLRLRTEEAAGRLEPLLSTAVSRGRWLASHVLITAGGAVVVLAATGISGAVAYWIVTGDLGTGLGMLAAASAQVPAVFALGGFVIAVFALLPGWSAALSWAALAVSLVMGQLGEVLELPQPVLNLSPFTHSPPVPAESFTFLPVGVLLVAGLALAGLGWAGFRRRDLAITA